MQDIHERVITEVDAREFFQGEVQSALSNQDVTVSGETVVYLAYLLTAFINSDQLFERTSDGVILKPLAVHYKEALEADNTKQRCIKLRRLGDVSLFISGIFAQSLCRSLVDIDYYISMGGNAYGHLSETETPMTSMGFKIVFSELAENFSEMTDVLSEVGESINLINSYDILRLYEIWQQTGSKRVAEQLKNSGIHPVKTGKYRH